VSDSLLVIGACFIVAGFAFIYPPLGLLSLGVFLVLAGVYHGLPRRPPTDSGDKINVDH